MVSFVNDDNYSVQIFYEDLDIRNQIWFVQVNVLVHFCFRADLEGSIVSENPISGTRRTAREEQPVAGPFRLVEDSGPALYDRPSFARERIVYVSTKDPITRPRESSNAVFSTHSETGITNRLTPQGVTDYSPAVSPSGIQQLQILYSLLWPGGMSSISVIAGCAKNR